MMCIKDNIAAINLQIENACQQANRSPEQITLLAVSKTKPIEMIEQAYQTGQRCFGENYIQEAVDKISQLTHLQHIVWHYIGPIQSNKTKLIAEHFDWVQSVDRAKVITRLNEQRSCNHTPLNICLQVNISQESSKSGVAINELAPLAEQVHLSPNLTLRGLMAIPEKNNTTHSFQQMKRLFDDLKQRYKTVDTLSMGMSNDMNEAIASGTTMVRIGTAIFGER
ncbi:YggS family pyridoxal phosphate-dependent enzyme [Thalassotalea profundi]|uniref:Pyridoxal phosphate homeostasis protein n=1 Tax=Thalassotalea profundi TaxID=2036687 RepID=A0ABQ3IDK6_9GAMM|nr:YggS family pyridoxal phosphate-dependent enzyme [Thalassotalea profundi]GHE77035.1 YggS family pyridoxal phosphate enzyme [Thalassotalea profundi]